MSFSNDVKDELLGIVPNARHCRLAELAGIVLMCLHPEAEGPVFRTESRAVAEMVCLLYKKVFNKDAGNIVSAGQRLGKENWEMEWEPGACEELFEAIKLTGISEKQQSVDKTIQNVDNNNLFGNYGVSRLIYRQPCCKRAFLRGLFVTCGSMTDPMRDYHLEFVMDREVLARIPVRILADFDIEAKVVARKNSFVVYIKDSETIADILNILEAHVSLMNLENVRIYKDVRNLYNRRNNCDVANINKTVNASNRQIKDIEYLRDTIGLEDLSEELVQTARLRLEYPEASLAELGNLHEPPVGRSGVNHRLGKLSRYAQLLREGKPINC